MEQKPIPNQSNKKKYPKINNIMNLVRTLLFLPLFCVFLIWIIVDLFFLSKWYNFFCCLLILI